MKKIMFKDKYGLTDAVLQGRKTMTRRMVTDYEFNQWDGRQIMLGYDPESNTQEYGLLSDDGSGEVVRRRLLKYTYRCGEVLAVAQSYKDLKLSFIPHIDEPDFRTITKHAPQWGNPRGMKGWNNKMFVRADLMPHQIKITDIKVERLQDISEDDCLKEGVWIDSHREVLDDNIYTVDVFGKHYCQWHFPSTREAFSFLIDKVSGKGTWERDPWVFAYSFELIK